MSASVEHDPLHHTEKIKRMLNEMIQLVHGDVAKVTEPKAMALFETTAEVLKGLAAAYEHYEAKIEQAWR